MTQLIRTDNGAGILIEVETREPEAQRAAAGEVVTTITKSFATVTDALKAITKPFANTWKELSKEVTVDEAKVKLSLGITATGNFYVVKGDANANFEVELTLKPLPPQPPEPQQTS